MLEYILNWPDHRLVYSSSEKWLRIKLLLIRKLRPNNLTWRGRSSLSALSYDVVEYSNKSIRAWWPCLWTLYTYAGNSARWHPRPYWLWPGCFEIAKHIVSCSWFLANNHQEVSHINSSPPPNFELPWLVCKTIRTAEWARVLSRKVGLWWSSGWQNCQGSILAITKAVFTWGQEVLTQSNCGKCEGASGMANVFSWRSPLSTL